MEKKYLQDLEARFLRYVQFDTQSDESSTSIPSTARQLKLLNLLVDELQDIGLADVRLTDYACVLATIPATVESAPSLAFLSHVDTAPDFSGTGVRPVVHRNYDGAPIVFPDDPNLVLDPDKEPLLKDKLSHDIVTASGKTLLGADDKSGVAIMMTLAVYLLQHPEILHGPVRLCFTPDEEIGRGVQFLKLEDLQADVAYTLDGGLVGEINYETFSADRAVVKISGVSTHTGDARGKMVNALKLAVKFIGSLPQDTLAPEIAEDCDGFIHPYKLNGTPAEAEIRFILRDFELEGLAAQRDLLQSITQTLQAAEPRAKIECSIESQYRNMRYWLEKNRRSVDLAIDAVKKLGLTPTTASIRGGTDGARLTERGLPTPNLFTGMHNYHGPLEWVSLQDMAIAMQLCLEIAQAWARAR